MKRFICALLVAVQLAACTTLSTVPYGEDAVGKNQARPVAPGDELRLTFREGGQKRIKVTTLGEGQICAADGCIAATEIAGIERVERSVPVGGIVLVALGALVLAALFSSMHGLGGAMAATAR